MKNITDPDAFNKKLKEVMRGIYNLFELAEEQKCPWQDPCGFQIPDSLHRGEEFLQTLLDLIRCNFDPNSMGTLLLNSNMGHIYDAIPEHPFRLAYASTSISAISNLLNIWKNDIAPKLNIDDRASGSSTQYFIVISTGENNYNLELVNETANFILDNLPDETISGGDFGFCLDRMLKSDIRISVWAIYEE